MGEGEAGGMRGAAAPGAQLTRIAKCKIPWHISA